MVLLAYSFKLPPPLGTPSYPRGRVVYLVFEDGGVLKHQQNKNLQDSNISKSVNRRILEINPLYVYPKGRVYPISLISNSSR